MLIFCYLNYKLFKTKETIKMKIIKGHKIRLDPNNKQANYFVRACGVARFAYNWGLDEWKRQYEAGEKPSAFALDKQFNFIKKQEFPFVTEVAAHITNRSFINLGAAFQKFFKNIRTGKKPGYPRHKHKLFHNKFYVVNHLIKFENKKVYIPKLGWVRMRESLRLEGKILSATVSRAADKWFISIQVEQDIEQEIPEGPVIGVDVGIKNLATVSDGSTYTNPKALREAESRLRLLQKSVSRKKKGSKNRKKAIIKLQKEYHKVSCIRSDSIHKATFSITTGAAAIGIEDLNIKGMIKNHKLSKSLSDASLSEFLRQLEYKAEWKNIPIVKADRFYPSSKTCSCCGEIKEDLKLSDRIFKCDHCGLEIDRDLNAAINLKNLAVGSTVLAYRLGSAGCDVSHSATNDWVGNSRVAA